MVGDNDPDLVDVIGDNDDMDNYGCGTATKAVVGDAKLQSFGDCMLLLNGYHNSKKINDDMYLRVMNSFQTQTGPEPHF